MTNPVNQQKLQPANYSGVTINITNPTVNAGTEGCTCPIGEPNVEVIRQNSSEMYGLNQPVVPYYYNPSDSLRADNVYNEGLAVSNAPNQTMPNQVVTQTQYPQNAQPQQGYQAQYPQYNQLQQPVAQAQYPQGVQPQQGYPAQYSQYNQVQQPVEQAQYPQNVQTQQGYPAQYPQYIQEQQPEQLSQQNQASQNIQPAQYYLNNYNYNGVNPNGEPISSTNSYTNYTNMQPKNDMATSEGIINNLNERDAKQKELEENGEKKRVVALTNEYIMSLENYLNNPNTDIRLMAAKEILTRLDEDRSRCDDAALNALLNKMLQDPEKIIRIAAMSALSSGLATGNDYTMKLLNNIQQDPNADKEDVLEVSQILLKMAETSEERFVPVKIKTEEAQNNA